MPRSSIDTRISGWYDGSDSRWSRSQRQKLFDENRDAGPVCDELRNLCPRHAEVINIEAKQDDPSPDVASPMFSPSVDWYSKEKRAYVHLECHRAASPLKGIGKFGWATSAVVVA